jgi:hypothetical protein
MTTMINTHRLVKRLVTEGNMSEASAEALSEALNEALSDSVATKSDLNILEHRLRNHIWSAVILVASASGVINHFFK